MGLCSALVPSRERRAISTKPFRDCVNEKDLPGSRDSIAAIAASIEFILVKM
jgi:hypothetical protein